MAILEDEKSLGAIMSGGRGAPRSEFKNPRNPMCALEFKRICGVCAHYGGALRPAPGASDRARCGYFGLEKGRLDKASGCHRFTRKAAENG